MPQRDVSSKTRPQHEQLQFETSKHSLLDQDDDYSQQNSDVNLISPDNASHGDFANFDDAFDNDDHSLRDPLFEPYHDPQTNRIIMRMRMGTLMNEDDVHGDPELDQYEDSSIVATEAVQDQSPAWAIFDNPAFDKFSLFNTKSKEEEDPKNDTPFDQVSYTDPYNAWAHWDSLPTFLQSPYSFMSQAKNNLVSPISSNKQNNARQKIKQKMKETRINKQGFLEESTITTAAPSSSDTISDPPFSASIKLQQQHQDAPETSLEQPYALSKHQQQPQELKKTISSTSTDASIPLTPKEDPPESNPSTPRRLSTERLGSPFRQASADDGDDEKKQDLPSTPRTRLTKSRLESPFQQNETNSAPVDAPGLPSAADAEEIKSPPPPGRLNPDRLKSPFQQEQQEEGISSKEPLQSPPKRLSQSRIQSPFLQQQQVQEEPKSPVRSSPPASPLRPALKSPKSMPEDSTKTRRKVSLSPPSTPSLLHKVDEDQPSSKLDSILDSYRAMIENKAVTSKQELETIMKQDGHLTRQEIKCFVFALGISMSGESPKRRVKMNIKPSSSSSDAGTTTSGNSISSQQRFKARASSKSTPFDQNISNLMAQIKKDNVIPARRHTVRADDDAKTSISAVSAMSCRELSIQRLRRRIANSRKNEKSEVDQLLQDLQEAQSRQKRLETQLQKAGIQIAEDIPYETAKAKVAQIAQQMQEIGTSQATHPDPKIQAKLRQDYFVLEQQMEKYIRALELTDEYLAEQERLERAFDDDNREENNLALEQVWKHMPVNIRQHSIDDWLNTPSPSGRCIPKPFLLKFARTNILTLLRMQPDFVQRAHPSNLEQRRVTGLTLTERRALQAYLFPIATKWRNAKDALTKRKWNWYCILRQTLKDHLLTYQRHVAQHEQLEGGLCTCNGLKCPVKANRKLDYFQEDYGYPADVIYPEYEQPGDLASSPAPTQVTNPSSTDSTPKPKPPATARHSLMAELSAPKANNNKRQSLMADIATQKSKMKARPSSLMDEIAAKAAMRQASKGL